MPAYDLRLIKFYNSQKWKNVRRAYRIKKRGICERCGKSGTEVHHKTYLTPENVLDPNIAVSFGNLELLCKVCHNTEHDRCSKQIRKGFSFNSLGELIPPGQK